MRREIKFLRNNKAIAALEFAFILPILLAMILGTIEYSRAFYYQYKANKISSAFADAITMSVPYYKPDGTTDCSANKLVLTQNRLRNEIVNADNIAILATPLNPSRIFIRVSSVYQGYGVGSDADDDFTNGSGDTTPPFLIWAEYFGNSDIAPGELRDTRSWDPDGNLTGGYEYGAKLPAPYTAAYNMFPGENIIIVEVYIQFGSVISGLLQNFVPALESGVVSDISYYSPRNYWPVSSGGERSASLAYLKTGGC